MILLFGGAYQGKLAYAIERFGLAGADVFQCRDDAPEVPAGKKIIYELDKWLLAVIKDDADLEGAMALFTEKNKNAVVIVNDISCGVVPACPVMRKWREAVGRAMAELSQVSDETIRLFCGIPTKIK